MDIKLVRKHFDQEAERIARDWLDAELDGRETHPQYADQMYHLHKLAKSVLLEPNAADERSESQ